MANRKHDYCKAWSKDEGSMKYSDARRTAEEWNEVNRKYKPKEEDKVANSIMVLYPYKYQGQWVFDDENTFLFREAFVGGTDKILDEATKDIPGAENGFVLIFSAIPFPGYQYHLKHVGEEYGGNVYHCEELNMDGWLCPSLFKYFPEAPKDIYALARHSEGRHVAHA